MCDEMVQHITDVTERGGEGRGGLCAMKWHVVVMSSDMNCRSGPGIGNGRSV